MFVKENQEYPKKKETTELDSHKPNGNPKILQVSRVESPISRFRKVESIEQLIMQLTEAFKARGIAVNVAAPADSLPFEDFNILPTIKKSFGERYNPQDEPEKNILKLEHYQRAFSYAAFGNFDIIHDHYHLSKLYNTPPISNLFNGHPLKNPILISIHVPPSYFKNGSIECLKKIEPYVHFSVVSESQRKLFIDQAQLDASRIFTVHNGINPDEFPLHTEKKGYLLFIGRITPDKGVKTACEVAREAGKTLIISGYVNNQQQNEDYFERELDPLIDFKVDLSEKENLEAYTSSLLKIIKEKPKKIIFVGRSSSSQRVVLYQHASALLFTTGTENECKESFGLVQIEANATGTPVLAYDNGGVREIIKPGINGIIAQDFEGLVRGAKEIHRFPPEICRRYVEENFTIENTAAKYLGLYKEIIERHEL